MALPHASEIEQLATFARSIIKYSDWIVNNKAKSCQNGNFCWKGTQRKWGLVVGAGWRMANLHIEVAILK
jgi:hypothetical protein